MLLIAKKRMLLRKQRARQKIRKVSNRLRLCVTRTCRHIYAQIIDDSKGFTLASASTLEKEFYKKNASNSNLAIAEIIGTEIANRASKLGIKSVVFDRSGNKYHGIVKALADAARKKLNF